MAVGALLGVVAIRRDGEHVVALDADAMQHGAVGGRSFVLLLFFGRGFVGHGRILAYCGRGGRQAEEEEISDLKFEI